MLHKYKRIIKIDCTKFLFLCYFFLFSKALALPTWFLQQYPGTQSDVQWQRLQSDKFSVYFEPGAVDLAKYALHSADFAYKHIGLILGTQLNGTDYSKNTVANYFNSRFDTIPLAISTRARQAAFSNFLTGAIELPISDGGPASLFSHELVHQLMYRQIDIGGGPASRAFSMAMIPSWWVEGLAEYLAEARGRIESLGSLRSMYLEDSFLSWARIHSLYSTSGDISARGYSIAGRFFKFLMEHQPKPTSLPDLLADLRHEIVIPPFVNAMERLLQKHWNKSGEELYKDFIAEQRSEWSSYLDSLPSLTSATLQTTLTQKPWFMPYIIPVATTKNGQHFFSSLHNNKELSSINEFQNLNQIKRVPVEHSGTHVLSFEDTDDNNHIFWSTRLQKYSNGTIGYSVTRWEQNAETNKIKNEVEFQTSTQKDPAIVTQIQAVGNKKSFVVTNIRGQYSILFLDAVSKNVTLLKKWNVPISVKLIPKINKTQTDSNCISFIINADKEETSLNKICSDQEIKTIIESKKIFIQNGLENNDGSYVLTVAWDKTLGFIKVDNLSRIYPIAPFPEWVEDIFPWGEDSNTIGTWSYSAEKGGFYLSAVSLKTLTDNYASWLPSHKSSALAQAPIAQPYAPPYVRMTSAAFEKTPEIKFYEETASYRNKHFFTYPYPIPPAFGGWSLGIASIPLQDELERHKLQVLAYYNFYTNSPSGTVSYISNRILDGFTLSAFGRDRFNGIYNDAEKNTKLYSYLNEKGLEAFINYRILPTSLNTSLILSYSKINPQTENLGESLGVQYGNIIQYGAQGSATIAEKSFYIEDKNTIGGRYLSYKLSTNFFANHAFSVGSTSYGNHSDGNPVDYKRVGGEIINGLFYKDLSLQYRYKLTGTIGNNPLNLLEIYQPYQTYLTGSGSSINQQNYSLYGSSNLFARSQNRWAYKNNLTFKFPIIKNIEKTLSILYLDLLEGEITVGRGGVGDRQWQNFTATNSMSTGLRLHLDVKGFQILPSIAYGRTLGEKGWNLFSEIGFSNFF